jgi:hypothetical protein
MIQEQKGLFNSISMTGEEATSVSDLVKHQGWKVLTKKLLEEAQARKDVLFTKKPTDFDDYVFTVGFVLGLSETITWAERISTQASDLLQKEEADHARIQRKLELNAASAARGGKSIHA